MLMLIHYILFFNTSSSPFSEGRNSLARDKPKTFNSLIVTPDPLTIRRVVNNRTTINPITQPPLAGGQCGPPLSQPVHVRLERGVVGDGLDGLQAVAELEQLAHDALHVNAHLRDREERYGLHGLWKPLMTKRTACSIINWTPPKSSTIFAQSSYVVIEQAILHVKSAEDDPRSI